MVPDPSLYLSSCEFINSGHPAIRTAAASLRGDDVISSAKNCFEFVHDNIKHSSDFQQNPVTCRASDVLEHQTGYCYAKSHLLCALLRANQIPAGLCYQRLSVDGDGAPFCLHGLNAVYLPEFGWYRVDPRGNRSDVHAEFSPPVEKLAFSTSMAGEADLETIHVSPLQAVTTVLTQSTSWDDVLENLPDIDDTAPTAI